MNVDKITEMLDGSLEYGPAPESDESARLWLDSHKKVRHFINGKWSAPSDRKYFKTANPGTGEVLAQVAWGSKRDVNRAFIAANQALNNWKNTSAFERERVLYAVARNLRKNARELAVLESLDNGKTIRETRDIDMPLVEKWFHEAIAWAAVAKEDYPNHRPYGVVAQVIPWNFPLLMMAWKIGAALATGNTVVIKPAEITPLSAARFAEILMDSGLPPGIVNVVFGKGDTGELVVSHELANKVAFTGSTDVGRRIRHATAGTGIGLTLELGGKSRTIITENADLDSAVDGKIEGSFLNQGHVCCACSLDLVHESIYSEYVDKLKRRVSTLIGAKPPHFQLDKNPDIGAVNSKQQLEKITRLVDEAKAEGADVWQPDDYVCPSDGFYYPPTVVTNVDLSSEIAITEIFGPVVVVMSYRTVDEAIKLANNSRYGLAASVWTQDIDEAFHIATSVKAGTVWVNSANLFDPAAGFGGYRESGYGREGGREGILEYIHEDFGEPEDEEDSNTYHNGLRQSLDRTHRFFIGGKLTRPDQDRSFKRRDNAGNLVGVFSDANRKDIRNAVEAARGQAATWASRDAFLRAQILRFIAENLSEANMTSKFIESIVRDTGRTEISAETEVMTAIERLFYFAARAKMYEGTIQSVPGKYVVTAVKEPIGVVGVRCPDRYPLLGFVNTFAPLYAFGNSLVMIAGRQPLAASEFIRLLENSDIPPGTVNVLTAHQPDIRAIELAEHEDVDAIWFFGDHFNLKAIEEASVSNMKRVFSSHGAPVNWLGTNAKSLEFLRQSVNIKNIWVPFGT